MYRHQLLSQCILLIMMFVFIMIFVCPANCEREYFPGLRRPPNWAQSQAADEATDFLSMIIEEQARRRFQERLAQHHHQRGPNAQNHQNAIVPSFTYSFPDNIVGQSQNDDDIPFAVNPSDPRYYEGLATNPNKLNSIDENNDDNYRNNYYQQHKQHNQDLNIKSSGSNAPYSRLKPPMEVNPKMPSQHNSLGMGHDLNALVDKLERERQTNPVVNEGGNLMQQHQRTDTVTKKHMGIEGEMGMYIVALIAGVSAAVTVGLIAIGIGWYTLQKRTKAAADVDYPAYGVTGPNKDISPSGDRRLAQSAQMYHYQHQKQQIIAMENRTGSEHAGGISDVESDDDNDEGDYTVYECPGLAPTGEMEVKNPLFLDDTPVTPSNNSVEGQAHLQQQQQQQQQQQHNIPSTQFSSTTVSSKQATASKKSSNKPSLTLTSQSGQQQHVNEGSKKASKK